MCDFSLHCPGGRRSVSVCFALADVHETFYSHVYDPLWSTGFMFSFLRPWLWPMRLFIPSFWALLWLIPSLWFNFKGFRVYDSISKDSESIIQFQRIRLIGTLTILIHDRVHYICPLTRMFSCNGMSNLFPIHMPYWHRRNSNGMDNLFSNWIHMPEHNQKSITDSWDEIISNI